MPCFQRNLTKFSCWKLFANENIKIILFRVQVQKVFVIYTNSCTIKILRNFSYWIIFLTSLSFLWKQDIKLKYLRDAWIIVLEKNVLHFLCFFWVNTIFISSVNNVLTFFKLNYMTFVNSVNTGLCISVYSMCLWAHSVSTAFTTPCLRETVEISAVNRSESSGTKWMN